MNLFITGGTGFFGRALLKHYLSDISCYRHVTVLTRDPKLFISSYPHIAKSPSLSLLKGDVLDSHRSWQGSADLSPDHIIHAATDSTLGPTMSPKDRFQQIHDGTRNILDFAITYGARRFLLTSSGAIYGPQSQDEDSLSEESAIHLHVNSAENAYGVGKLAAEHLCALYADEFGLETIIARCFAFIGPDLPLGVHFAIGNFVRDALWADEITVQGDGSPLRTYLDQDDLANWLFTLLEKGRAGKAYNVGSDEVVSIKDLAYLVRDLIAPDKRVRLLRRANRSAALNRYVPDISRAQRELGLSVTIPLSESIRRTFQAHRRLDR